MTHLEDPKGDNLIAGARIPVLSVIVPVRNEADHIEACLRAILDSAPPGGIEVLVADGLSTDDTAKTVKEFSARDARIHFLVNPGLYAPHALNLGLRAARGKYVARVDGHCRVEPGYFESCLKELDQGTWDCVGGTLVNEGLTATGRAVAAAMSSPIGVGGALFRTGTDRPVAVDTLAFGVYRRDVFDCVGNFDERLIRNQDDEFNLRIRLAGGQILLLPNLRVRYVVRNSIPQLGRQYFQYGYWKLKVMRKHQRIPSIRHVVPTSFYLCLLILAIMTPWSNLARIALGSTVTVYVISLLGEALRLSIRRRAPWLRTALGLGAMHASYAWGLLLAIFDALSQRRRRSDSQHTKLSR